MNKLQFRVLYREFLFRMVDLELLSAHAQGDSNKLMGQFASLLIFLSIGFSMPTLVFPEGPPLARVFSAYPFEHMLISTTMLVVGLFAVLSWDSTFPDRRDVLVLTPLPVRVRTMFLAKVAAVSSALAVTVFFLNAASGILWPLILGAPIPAVSTPALTWDQPLPPAAAPDMKAIMDRDLASALRNGAMAPGTHAGLVVGVGKFGKRSVLAYGAAQPDSIFELGPPSKTLTALILARMSADGHVRLNQPLGEVTSSAIAFNHLDGQPVTLLDLAIHHSGLPSMPGNLNRTDIPNPGANYSALDMNNWLTRWREFKHAGPAYSYSNLGYGLLGTTLAARAGIGFPELLQREITGPLAMKDTAIALTPEQEARIVPSYGPGQQPMPMWDLGVLAPAATIRSTAADMLNFLDANLHPERLPDDFSVAIQATHVERTEIGNGTRIALGWAYDSATGSYFHSGFISGYTTYIFFDPRRDYAGIVFWNRPPEIVAFGDLVGEHVRQRLAGERAVSLATLDLPERGGLLMRLRSFAAYWIAMFAAATFIYCFVLGAQGLSAQLLPRRWFLRASSFLQLAAFALFVGVYFLQPLWATPSNLRDAQGSGLLAWSPSYWFLGLMEQLRGSPALATLSFRACVALPIALGVTAAAYALSYFRTLRKIVEEPDIVPGARRGFWLPPAGSSMQTAIAHFSIRTLLRSRQHRVILAFYLGIGFAMTIFLLRAPEMAERFIDADAEAHQVSIAFMASTLLMLIAAVVGTRVLFSMPIDLRANWVFRITSQVDGLQYLRAARRSLWMLSVVPVWSVSAVLCFALWPWQPAAAHIVALGMFAVMLADLSVYEYRKIPFTCSYMPGKSQVHMVILSALALLYFSVFAVRFERDVLSSPASLAALLTVLALGVVALRWRSIYLARSEPTWIRFEDSLPDEVLLLKLG